MNNDEIYSLVCQYSNELNEKPENYKPIPKDELTIGETYSGICRNTREATWDGKQFTYTRYKLGEVYEEKINHYEDDNGYDLFIPIKHN